MISELMHRLEPVARGRHHGLAEADAAVVARHARVHQDPEPVRLAAG